MHERSQALLDRETGTLLTRSPAERELTTLLRAPTFRRLKSNVWLEGYEVDFFWPEHRLVVELDGFQFHSTGPRSSATT